MIMHVMYCNPIDFPDSVVIRKYDVILQKPGKIVVIADTIELADEKFNDIYPNSFFIHRHDDDDDCVVGTYI